MSTDAPVFEDISLELIPITQIVEVDENARTRYGKHYAKPSAAYTQRFDRDHVRCLLTLWPITVVQKRSRKSDVLLYRVVAGLKSWAIVRSRSDFAEVPCQVLKRNSPAIKNVLNQAELVTCQALMRSESSYVDWIHAHDSILDSDQRAAGSPMLDKGEVAELLGVSKQTVTNARNHRN